MTTQTLKVEVVVATTAVGFRRARSGPKGQLWLGFDDELNIDLSLEPKTSTLFKLDLGRTIRF